MKSRIPMRKVHIGATNTPWEYRVSDAGNVIIRHPVTGKKSFIFGHVVRGVTADTFERGRYKRTRDGVVLPRDVKKYIEEHLW